MHDLNGLGKTLIVLGSITIIVGFLFILHDKIPLIGKLPGDLSCKGKNWAVYFPLGTSILLSILLSVILYLIKKFTN